MAGPLGGTVGDPVVPTTYVRDVDSGAPGRHCRRPKSATTYVGDVDGGPLGGAIGDLGASTTYVRDINGAPLGGAVRDLGVPTTYVGDVDGGPPRKHSRRSMSAHHLCRRRRWHPLGGPVSVHGLKMCCDLRRQHR
jgi:hypothetical protein